MILDQRFQINHLWLIADAVLHRSGRREYPFTPVCTLVIDIWFCLSCRENKNQRCMAGGHFLRSPEQQHIAQPHHKAPKLLSDLFSWTLPHLCRAENFLPTVCAQEFCQQRFCLFSDSRGVRKGWNGEVLLVQASSLLWNLPHPTAEAWAVLLGWKVLNYVLPLGPHTCRRWCISNTRPGLLSLSYFVPGSCLATYQSCLKPLIQTGALDPEKNIPVGISREDSSYG